MFKVNIIVPSCNNICFAISLQIDIYDQMKFNVMLTFLWIAGTIRGHNKKKGQVVKTRKGRASWKAYTKLKNINKVSFIRIKSIYFMV